MGARLGLGEMAVAIVVMVLVQKGVFWSQARRVGTGTMSTAAAARGADAVGMFHGGTLRQKVWAGGWAITGVGLRGRRRSIVGGRHGWLELRAVGNLARSSSDGAVTRLDARERPHCTSWPMAWGSVDSIRKSYHLPRLDF